MAQEWVGLAGAATLVRLGGGGLGAQTLCSRLYCRQEGRPQTQGQMDRPRGREAEAGRAGLSWGLVSSMRPVVLSQDWDRRHPEWDCRHHPGALWKAPSPDGRGRAAVNQLMAPVMQRVATQRILTGPRGGKPTRSSCLGQSAVCGNPSNPAWPCSCSPSSSPTSPQEPSHGHSESSPPAKVKA